MEFIILDPKIDAATIQIDHYSLLTKNDFLCYFYNQLWTNSNAATIQDAIFN